MSNLVHCFSMGYLCPRKLDERKKKGVLQDLCFLLGITFASSGKRKRVRTMSRHKGFCLDSNPKNALDTPEITRLLFLTFFFTLPWM